MKTEKIEIPTRKRKKVALNAVATFGCATATAKDGSLIGKMMTINGV